MAAAAGSVSRLVIGCIVYALCVIVNVSKVLSRRRSFDCGGGARGAGPRPRLLQMDDDAGMQSRTGPGPALIRLVAVAAIVVAACVGTRVPSGAPSMISVPSPTLSAPASPPGPASSTGEAFAHAWLDVAGTFDAQAAELMISNPLSEWDLVGFRFIDLIDETRRQLSVLAPPARLSDEVLALDAALAATLRMLAAIAPDAPRASQEEAFRRALDDWVEHVRPRAQAIRDALGLPPVPPGDVQL